MDIYENAEKAGEHFEGIIDSLNSIGGGKEVLEVVSDKLERTHRTLQANFWRFIQQLSKKYAEYHTENPAYQDARNQAAIEYVKKINEVGKEAYIDFI